MSAARSTDRSGRHPVVALLCAVSLVVFGAAGPDISTRLMADDSQVFAVPQAEVENVRFEQAPDGTVHVLYDLISDDPNALFFVTLEASMNAGESFDMIPPSVTGDIGAGVTAGPGKRIVWEAGRDVEVVRIDLFRFRIVTEAAAVVPAGMSGLIVVSVPPGAAVEIDGDNRGVTPLSLEDLTPGEHAVVVALDGYLENRQTVTVPEDDTERVSLVLTPLTDEELAAQADSGGGPNLAVILPIVGGGAAAALLALSGGGSDTGGNSGGGTSCSFSVSPTSFSVNIGGGGQKTVRVTVSPAGCSNPSWSVSGVPSWISIRSGRSGSGNGTVTFQVSRNASASRTATLRIAGQSVTVRQDGRRTGTETLSGAVGSMPTCSGSHRCVTRIPARSGTLSATVTITGSTRGGSLELILPGGNHLKSSRFFTNGTATISNFVSAGTRYEITLFLFSTNASYRLTIRYP
jgi:hypothetical protein